MKKTGAWLIRYAPEQIGVKYTFGIPGVYTTEIYDQLSQSELIQRYSSPMRAVPLAWLTRSAGQRIRSVGPGTKLSHITKYLSHTLGLFIQEVGHA